MYAAFPRSEYLWASPTSTVASASLRMVLSVGLLGPHANQDGGGSPRFLTLPFPDVPCSKTPPQSPVIIANSDHLLLPSRYSTLSACGCRLTRLNRFTCVTACPSLCLRLAHVVTSTAQGSISGGAAPPLAGAGISPAGSAKLGLARRST